MKKLIKITAFILILSFAVSSAASALTWPAQPTDGLNMPFRPSDKYVTDQNPPDFRWQYVSDAESYDIVVSKSEDLSSPVYKKEGITTNYYNFDTTFETGVNYWWAVRFTDSKGNKSDYSNARRFRISTHAHEFPVPSTDVLLSRIPASHPRILATCDTLDEIRDYKNQSDLSKKAYTAQLAQADSYVTRLKSGALSLEEPAYTPPVKEKDEAAYQQYQQSYRGKIQTSTSIAHGLGFCYMLLEDDSDKKSEYAYWGKQAIIAALKIGMKKQSGKWVMDSSHPASYPGESSGQSFREITYKCAMAYDWFYNGFTESEKAEILELLTLRTEKMLGVITNCERIPYQSHGWTILGFLGIVGVATYGDIPEAEEWLERILPLYTNLLPPWGYEDGGWSQGVDYWQWSSTTNQEFMNVLTLAGIIDLYDKAWAYKEHLWSIYVYPYGSYGSFGDGAGINKAGSSSLPNIANTAYFTKNPVARWAVANYGDSLGTAIKDYYTGMLVTHQSKEPTEYTLGYEFDDIGWAVMTDSLSDENRIQLTFKSSPFGSYNHVAAEQNSFFLQAYGQILAGKSGYYDSYHSPHHATISKATFAHNSITVDGAKGQSNANFNAKGNTTSFVSHMSFDSVTGDATEAYVGKNNISANATPQSAEGELDKFVRSIIYIRPGVFVVIDDLDAKGEGESSFEWWLNSPVDFEYTNNSAYIENGVARLQADVVYPQNTKATYYDGFVNPIDGNVYPGGGTYETQNQHNRVRFATEKTAKTKMIVAMSVYNDESTPVSVEKKIAPDGSYCELTFGDGTVCVVNLGDSSTEVSNGTVKFKGIAATYNDESIMLTEGKSLNYDGSSVVTTAYPTTIAIGHGQIAMSVTEDSNNGAANTITLRNNNKFISVASEESLTDNKGRNLSMENGFYNTRVSSSLIRLYPYKGNYNLYVDGADVSVKAMIPKNLKISKSDGKYYVLWDFKPAYSYDVVVNGLVTEDVSSPWEMDISDGEKLYNISVRAKNGSVISDWSENVYLSPMAENTYSYVQYAKGADGINVKVFAPNFNKENLNFFSVVCGEDGQQKAIVKLLEDGLYYTGKIPIDDWDSLRTYLWAEEGIKPLTPAATFNTPSLDLTGISIGGKLLKGYSNLKNDYTVEVTEGSYPSVKATAADASSKVIISHNYQELYSCIKIIASDGSERTVTLNYNFPNDDIHTVAGASAESSFIHDTARSKDLYGNYNGMISRSSVGVLKWDIVYPSTSDGKEAYVVNKTSNLKVYTNLAPNKGGINFGSRVTSDRNTNKFNYSEYTNPAKEHIGYDHIVFPNQAFISNIPQAPQGYKLPHVENAKANFAIEKPTEITILSSAAIDILEKQGFRRDPLYETTNGRYMVDKPHAEDVYYNIVLCGASTADLTAYEIADDGSGTYGYLTDYDVAATWIDVEPISGCTTLKDYIDAGYSKNKFAVKGTLVSLESARYYYYPCAYVKEYDVIEATDVNIDFGSFSGEAPRMIVVLKPLNAKKPITNFRYEGVLKYSDLSDAEKSGCNDSYTEKRAYSSFNSAIMRKLENGAIAYVDNGTYTIDNINPMLELEGAYFVPPHRYLNTDSSADNWMKAYYYGMGNVNGLSYPGLAGKSHILYSFDLNRSATMYVVTYGTTPGFIDSTWHRMKLSEPAFTLDDAAYRYTDVYVKNVEVPYGESVNVTMKTPGTGKDTDGVYFLIVKPE